MAAEQGELMKRLRELELSQAELWEELGAGRRERGGGSQRRIAGGGGGEIAGFFARGAYYSVLQHIGHAVYVSRPGAGEIIYWNQSAESLYGWKDCEALGQKAADLLIDEDSRPSLEKAMERSNNGQSWSGRFPFRKKSGEMFIAMVTQSPLYEDSELIGVITVSSDATVLNDQYSEKSRVFWDQAHGQRRDHKPNFGRVQLRSQLQIASSVSTLAEKVLARLHIGGSFDHVEESDRGIQTNLAKNSGSNSTNRVHGRADESVPQNTSSAECCASHTPNIISKAFPGEQNRVSEKGIDCTLSNSLEEMTNGFPIGKEFHGTCKQEHHAANEKCLKENDNKDDAQPTQDLSVQAILQKIRTSYKKVDDKQSPTSSVSDETTGSSQAGSSSTGENNSKSLSDCDIRWEDLLLREEIGEGSCAVVYRGVWNGSDVAIKIYLRKDNQEGTLLGYRKEIAIMKKLRHPNVLLFMGAAYSPERLAIVTEFLPRGSLFRTLHKNSQALDLKRRLMMAFDVARGMNYLHRRNPPIIHRDLKSSNLLVDKNWTVKVGDFGLSSLKSSTVLTAKSGRGTPQWMAPEVLRGEFSNEKSDVFSYGVILWELMTESIPWSHLNSLQVVGVVGFMDRRLDLPEGLDPRVASIISDCWESDSGRRPFFQDIVGRMAELTAAVAPAQAHRRPEHPPREPPLDG